MHESYGRVIDLIANDAVNFRAIGLQLAKSRPDVFLALHDHVECEIVNPHAGMDEEIRKLYAVGQKVAAIKFCRERTGWGLKEAKDYCDALGAAPKPPTRSDMSALKSALDELLGNEGGAVKTDDEGTFR